MLNNDLRFHLWITYKACFVCGLDIEDFSDSSIEHIIPISKGGAKHSLYNLAISHKICNAAKGNSLNIDEWMQRLHELNSKVPRVKKIRSFGPTLKITKGQLTDCFSHIPELLKIIQTLELDKNVFKPHKKTNQLVSTINKLQSFETCEELNVFIESNIHRISNDWRIIFAMCFLEKFILTLDREALVSALINLKLYKAKPELPLTNLIEPLLNYCDRIDPELYYKYQKNLLHEELF